MKKGRQDRIAETLTFHVFSFSNSPFQLRSLLQRAMSESL